MKNKLFSGAATALVTPFAKDGSINFEVLKELIDFQISSGISALVIAGTTGEASTLSFEEFSALIARSNEFIRHRVPLIAGTGSNNTATAIKLSLEAEKRGADALLMVTPYYNKTTQEGLIQHYFAVADRVQLPIIVYHIPSRTGLKIAPPTYQRLAEHPNIIAIKEAGNDLSYVADVAAGCPELTLYSGNDDLILPLLSLGGEGVISVLSNLAPQEVQAICTLFKNGETAKAAQKQLELLPLIRAVFAEVNPIPIKRAMELRGFAVGAPRLPLVSCSEATEALLIQAIKARL